MTRRGYKEPWRWVRIAGYGIALVLGGAKGASLFGAIQGDEFSRSGRAYGSLLASGQAKDPQLYQYRLDWLVPGRCARFRKFK